MRASTFCPVVALLLSAAPAPAQEAAARGPEVEEVRFVGARALDEALLEATVATRETRCRSPFLAPACAAGDWRWAEDKAFLDTAVVRADEERLRELYDAWGYPEARVRARILPLDDGDVEVEFRIAEGEPLLVRSLQVRGLDTLPRPVPLPALPLRVGEPYALPRLEATQGLIARALAERGYAFAEVVVSGEVLPEESAAEVVLEVRPGPRAVFGPVEVLPEAPLSRDAVRERLAYRPGEPFTPAALERTEALLRALPLVDSVRVQFAPAEWADSVVETRVTVGVGRVQAFQVEGAFSSAECLRGVAWWGRRHLLGAPRVLTLSAGASNLLSGLLPCAGPEEGDEFTDPGYFLEAALREPLGARTWLLLEGSLFRESTPPAYVRRGFAGRVALSRELARGLQGGVGWAPERSDQLAAGVFFCGVHGVCGAGVEALTDPVTLAPVELTLAWTSPGAGLLEPGPRPGPEWLRALAPDWILSARGTLSGAGEPTLSELGFGRVVLEGSAVRFPGARTGVAARARVGALADGGDPLPPQVRLFGGGPFGVRGVAPNRLGPKVLLLRPGAEPGCPVLPGGCAGVAVDPEAVRVRPSGGTALVETGVEVRWWASRWARLSAFVDYGAVWSGAEEGAPLDAGFESVVTPGAGVFLLRPFGPLRVDLAYDPSPPRAYPLLAHDPDGPGFIVLGEAVYAPFEHGDPGPLREFWRRVQLQISSGLEF